MSGLARRLADAIGDRQFGDLGQQLAEIQARAGSGRAAARLVGVGDGTWRRWRAAAGLPGGGAGGKPARPTAGNLAKLAAAVVSGRVEQAAGRVQDMTIQATQRARDPREAGRVRNLNATNLRLAGDAGQKVAAAYYGHGAEAAAVAYVAAIGETSFYRPMMAAGVKKDWDAEGFDPLDDWWEFIYDTADEWEQGYGFDV